MKRLIVFILLALLLVGCSQQPIIEGPEEFQKDIHEALALLKEKSPEHHRLITENVKRIFYNKTDDFNGAHKDGSFGMTVVAYRQYTIFDEYKPYTIAVTLVHESVHISRYNNGRFNFNNLDKEEEIAYAEERRAAEIINAPDGTLDYIERSYKAWKEESQ
jgi:PBP1b-binding outer membrane lipoprotein LpoB